MAISFDTWAASVDGKYIDKDGYGNPPWQCHDVWLDYLVRVAGGSQGMGYAPTDFTDSVFTHFPVNGVDAVFTKHNGTSGMRKGDVVFWRFGSSNHPLSHVAVALAAPANGSVYCMSQNPGATQRLTLSLANALGYLRPKNATTNPPTTPPVQPNGNGALMFMIYRKDSSGPGRHLFAIVGPNFWYEFTGNEAASNINKQLTGSPEAPALSVDQSFWNNLKAAAGK